MYNIQTCDINICVQCTDGRGIFGTAKEWEEIVQASKETGGELTKMMGRELSGREIVQDCNQQCLVRAYYLKMVTRLGIIS